MSSFLYKIKQNLIASLFLKNTVILFSGTIIASVLNYLFNLIIGRVLTVDEYGQLVSLESIFLIVTMIGGAIILAGTRKVAEYKANKNFAKLAQFKSYFEKKFLYFGIIVFIILTAFSDLIAQYLKIQKAPIIIMASCLILAYVGSFYISILQGLQRFKALSIVNVIGTILKIILGVGLVLLGFSVSGAVVGYVFPSVICAVIIYLLLRDIKLNKADFINLQSIKISTKQIQSISYFFITSLCLTLLYNIDLILVKHYFSNNDAGLYSSLAMLARIIFFGTGIIASVLLPMATEKFERQEKHQHLFIYALLLVTVLGILLNILYFIFPEQIIKMLFGAKYLQSSNLLGIMSVVMTAYSILNLIITYLISIKKFIFLPILAAGSILQIIFIIIFHASLFQVIMICLIINSLISLISFMFVYFPKEKNKNYAEHLNSSAGL
ncbi:MAG: oligosaccharide flippase family protein [Patescibacteria group bacterium]|jgi:O-antigen/teichoic acid export membrane protein